MTITREDFLTATGLEPVLDDLERCNCPEAGQIGHWGCGWNAEHNRPQFMVGIYPPYGDAHITTRENLLKRAVEISGKLDRSDAASVTVGELGVLLNNILQDLADQGLAIPEDEVLIVIARRVLRALHLVRTTRGRFVNG